MVAKLPVSGINIVTHPHSPQGYIDLLYMLFRSRRHVQVYSSLHLMLGELKPIDATNGMTGLFGRLYRFVDIDKDATWFNVDKHDEATEEELAQINLPDELRPNTEMFDFVFYPIGHTFYFNMRSGNKIRGKQGNLGPGQVVKLFKILTSLQPVQEKFGQVDITVLPDTAQLEKILAIHSLQKLVIEVSKPNPDELGEAEAKVFSRLEKMKSRKLRQEIFAEKHESIELDEDTKSLARVAATNGKVVGSGYTAAHRKVQKSTVSKPWVDRVDYDPDIQTEAETLMAATSELPGHGG